MFPGRYRPTEEEFRKMWCEGLFVLDANALLNLYRYSDHTRGQLIEVLRGVEERLWLPHQVAYEFINRRLTVIAEQGRKYAQLREHLKNVSEVIEKHTSELHRDTALRAEDVLNPSNVQQSFDNLEEYLKKQEGGLPKLSNSPKEDEVWLLVDEVFDGKVGEPYAPERKKEVFEEGEKRYAQRVPPGYEDQDKDGEEQYGDLLVWFQILDKVKQANKPIVFVTDDRKGDWWWIFQKRTIGPRPELVEEIRNRAEVPFYIYPPGRFIEEAQRFLGQTVSNEAISEAQGLDPLNQEARMLWNPSDTAFSLSMDLEDTPEMRQLERQRREIERLTPPEVRKLERQQEELERLIPPVLRELQRQQEEIDRLIPPELREFDRQQREIDKMVPPEVRKLEGQEKEIRKSLRDHEL